MTASELIEQLKKCPGDQSVMIYVGEWDDCYHVHYLLAAEHPSQNSVIYVRDPDVIKAETDYA